jgi:type I restriction enzyme S subunit
MGNTPNIRFKGFTDDWEQRKLGKIVERVTRKNQDLVSELPLTISAQYGLIDQNEFFDKRVASKDVSGYYLIYNGEFAYNKSTSSDAPWGAIKRLDRYENGVLSTLYIVFRIKNEDILNSDFLMNYYDTNNWHKDIQAIASEGARNHGLLNIAPADFFETELMLPQDIEEQKNIGNYFKSLNNLITLHQRKCDETKKLKKFMLQKMFPKKDAKKPEIRFAGFTNDWEQRKLNEVAEFNPKSELPDEFEYVDLESVVGTEMISHRTETKDSAPSRAQRLAQPGDVFFQTVRPYQKNNYLFSKLDNNYVFSTGYAQMRPNIDTAFLMSFLQTDSFVKIVLDNCTGTSYPAINSSDLSNLEISLPKSFEEQKKVGKTIISIDNLITLHQRKCDELKEFKKYMLQNMFPQKG